MLKKANQLTPKQCVRDHFLTFLPMLPIWEAENGLSLWFPFTFL